MIKERKNPHYVNNKDFHDALFAYKMKIDIAKEEFFKKYEKYPANNGPWEGKPRIPNYIGDCFLVSPRDRTGAVPSPGGALETGGVGAGAGGLPR